MYRMESVEDLTFKIQDQILLTSDFSASRYS